MVVPSKKLRGNDTDFQYCTFTFTPTGTIRGSTHDETYIIDEPCVGGDTLHNCMQADMCTSDEILKYLSRTFRLPPLVCVPQPLLLLRLHRASSCYSSSSDLASCADSTCPLYER